MTPTTAMTLFLQQDKYPNLLRTFRFLPDFSTLTVFKFPDPSGTPRFSPVKLAALNYGFENGAEKPMRVAVYFADLKQHVGARAHESWNEDVLGKLGAAARCNIGHHLHRKKNIKPHIQRGLVIQTGPG